jgi:hypothetical protein
MLEIHVFDEFHAWRYTLSSWRSMLRHGVGIVQCHLFAGNRIFQRQSVPTGRQSHTRLKGKEEMPRRVWYAYAYTLKGLAG